MDFEKKYDEKTGIFKWLVYTPEYNAMQCGYDYN